MISVIMALALLRLLWFVLGLMLPNVLSLGVILVYMQVCVKLYLICQMQFLSVRCGL